MIARTFHHLRHWLTPHHTNNFRAKILHNAGYLSLIGLLFALNIFIRLLDSTPLHILGFTSSITIEEVVSLTNQQRIAEGLQPLKYNDTLSDAARRKAANMFEENYWAHNSPTGKTPWEWFKAAGYRYTFAGENLAKDFGSSDRMMSAWMSSPTHKANIVSDKFQEIGIAVVPGTLMGQETVLVVQLFGTTGAAAISEQAPQIAAVQATPTPDTKGVESAKVITTPMPVPVVTPAPTAVPAAVFELKEFVSLSPAPVSSLVRFDTFRLKRYAGLFTTGLLILVLIGDAIFAESRRLSRRVGKNWAHIIFINVILILVTVVNAGSIL